MCYNMFVGITQIQGKGVNIRAVVVDHLPSPPLYAWFYGHLTTPSTQGRRRETPTVAGVSRACPSVFWGKGNNLGVKHFVCFELWRGKNFSGSIGLVICINIVPKTLRRQENACTC